MQIRDTVAAGVLLTLVLHLLQVPLAIVLGLLGCLLPDGELCGTIGLAGPLLVGLSQLAYMLPAIYLARRRGRPALAKGLIIGAAVTFLLNAACWGTLGLALTGADFR
jgi:hypothetical protein